MESTNGDGLDEQFPLGDGVVEMSGAVVCPYCGESTEIALDPGGGARQTYEEDCEVCCRTWVVRVNYGSDGRAEVRVEATD